MFNKLIDGILDFIVLCATDNGKGRRSMRGGSQRKVSRRTTIRGKWSSRQDYMYALAGLFIGLSNFWTLPEVVYSHGRLTFLIVYLIALITFGCPVLMIEMGIGQVSQVSTIRTFNFVPICSGIGLSQFLLVFISIPAYSLYVVWAIYYFSFTVFSTQKWNLCNWDFNTVSCLSSYTTLPALLIEDFNYSTLEYWSYEVQRTMIYPELRSYDVNIDGIGNPNILVLLSVVFCWFILALLLLMDVKVSEKILWFTVLFPVLATLILTLSFFGEKDARSSIQILFKIRWEYFLDFSTYIHAYSYVAFTLCLGFGCSVNMSSFNDFYDNILRDSIILTSCIFIASIFSIIFAFAIYGYMRITHQVNFFNKHPGGPEFFFVVILRSFGNSDIWTVLTLITLMCFGIDTIMGLLETLCIIVCDMNVKVRKSKKKYLLFITILCSLFCLITLIYATPFGSNIFIALESLQLLSLILVFLELITITYLYGLVHIIGIFQQILGYGCVRHFMLAVAVFTPILLPTLIIGKAYLLYIKYNKFEILLIISLTLIILLPTIIFMIINIITRLFGVNAIIPGNFLLVVTKSKQLTNWMERHQKLMKTITKFSPGSAMSYSGVERMDLFKRNSSYQPKKSRSDIRESEFKQDNSLMKSEIQFRKPLIEERELEKDI